MGFPTFAIAVTVAVAAVSAAFGLERSLHVCKIRSEATEHILDHMIGPKAESLVSNFSRQMPISQMPSKANELIGIFTPDFDKKLRSGLDLKQPPIIKLQAIAISHCNRFRKVEKDIFALIRSQANAAAMARVKIKRQRACGLFLRPMSGGAMNRSARHRHVST
jgi:hypothetical protein